MVTRNYLPILFGLILIPMTGIFCCRVGPTDEQRELTQLYGDEFTEVYNAYLRSVLLAYETNDTSQLQETTIGYELKKHIEGANSKSAPDVAEWLKVELFSLSVKDYSENRAIISVGQRYIGNIPEHSRGNVNPRVVRLEKINGKWKVAHTENPLTNDDDFFIPLLEAILEN